MLALDIETTKAVRGWVELAGINDGHLFREIAGNRLNPAIDPGQINRLLKSIALEPS